METSAKTGHNIEAAFVQSASVINENIKNGQYDLRTENIGIKPGNTFKASFDENTQQIAPNTLMRNSIGQRKKQE